jgi:lipopolysaccharide assembly outer membrane protein LptD (OstA)
MSRQTLDRMIRRRPTPRLIACAALLGLLAAGGVQALAQEANTPPQPNRIDHLIQHSATGVIAPGIPLEADLELKAGKVNAWRNAAEHRLLLDGDVTVQIGSYGFKARKALVTITPLVAPGEPVYELAIYLDRVEQIGDGAVSAEAPRLLVTGTITGKIKLQANLFDRTDVSSDPLARAGVERITNFRQSVARSLTDLPDGPPLTSRDALARRNAVREQLRGTAMIERPQPTSAAPVTPTPRPTPSTPTAPTPPVTPGPDVVVTPTPPVTPTADPDHAPATPTAPQLAGHVDFGAQSVIYQGGDEEDYIILSGDVLVMYNDPQSGLGMTLRADRAVLLTDPQAIDDPTRRQAAARVIRGVYLEDNVIATDGQYTLRGPRVFYDLTTDRAIVLDAVFFTWDQRRQIPLYVRARALRQHSRTEWSARNARLSTSEFGEPHFALGASKLTIRKETDAKGADRYYMKGSHIAPMIGSLPVGYWPYVAGEASDPALRRADVSVNSRDGAVIRTRWDLFALTGQPKPEGLNASLLADGYTERGAGLGIEAGYDVPKAFGKLDGYFMYDTGTDKPGGRQEVTPADDTRGHIQWQHRHYINAEWEITLEAAWASDPTFLEEFFPGVSYAEKNYETLLYAKNQDEDWAFTFLAKYELTDFMTNLSQLQSPGYGVDKLPEIAYYRIATPVFGDRLTWYSENRASAMRLNLPDPTPGEIGFNNAQSVALFGFANNVPFEAALRNPATSGLDEQTRYRGDTRQELQLPMKVGFVDVVPYVVGRLTAYDQDFNDFSARVGRTENVRMWGALGVRLHTAFSKEYNDVENALFDLHRLRHIIEPSVDVFISDTNVVQEDWVTYDNDVESLNEGFAGRLGLRNTFQTQRGGPGYWRTVDFLRIDTDFIFHSDETQQSRLARFFGYRPEFSMPGDHFWSEVAAQLTDTFSFVGNVNYSFDNTQVEQWNVGLVLQHDPRLSSFIQHRAIDAVSSSILTWGFDYLLTPKYHISFSHGYDFANNESSSLGVLLTRRMPRMLVMVGFDYSPIDGDTSIGIAISPEGLGGSGDPERNPFLR